jgi:hypothetical protein
MNTREMAERYAQALNEKFAAVPEWKYAGTLSVDSGGRKYLRIVNTYDNGGRSVHAFVDATTGHLLKAAGWPSPAKGARGDLSTDAGFAAAVNRADPYGSYLYK